MSHIFKTGWLWKQGARFPFRWQRRCFVLSRGQDNTLMLAYFESASKYMDQAPRGYVTLAHSGIVRSGEKRLRVRTPSRELLIEAFSVADRDAWFDALSSLANDVASAPAAEDNPFNPEAAAAAQSKRPASPAAKTGAMSWAQLWMQIERLRTAFALLSWALLVESVVAGDCSESPRLWTPGIFEAPATLTQRGMLVVAAALLSLPWLSRPALLGFATLAPCIYTWALAASGEGRTFCHFVPPPVPTAPPSFVQLLSSSPAAGMMAMAWYPVLMLMNMRAGTGAGAHKPVDSWAVQLSMLAADVLFWVWLTASAYAHAHPGFAPDALLLEASLFVGTLGCFALHTAALIRAGALHPYGVAPLLLLQLLVIVAVVAIFLPASWHEQRLGAELAAAATVSAGGAGGERPLLYLQATGLTAVALGPAVQSALVPWSQRRRAARSTSPEDDVLEEAVPVVPRLHRYTPAYPTPEEAVPAEARPGRWLLAHEGVFEPWSLETHRAVATPTRRAAPHAWWLTRWEGAWNLLSALLPLGYLWSQPLLAAAGFCRGPTEWWDCPCRHGWDCACQASVSKYIDNPWATFAMGGCFYFPVMDMWRFGGVGIKPEGYLPGAHPLEFHSSRYALFYFQAFFAAFLVLADSWQSVPHLLATGGFCAAALVYNTTLIGYNCDVFGAAVIANLALGFLAAALTVGCVLKTPYVDGLPWPGSASPNNYFWLCEVLGLSSISLSAPLLHVAVLSRANVLQSRLDAKQAWRVLMV